MFEPMRTWSSVIPMVMVLAMALAFPVPGHVVDLCSAQGTGGGQGNNTTGTNGTTNTTQDNTTTDISYLKDYIVLYSKPLQPTQEDHIFVVMEVKPGSTVTGLNITFTIGYETWAPGSLYGVTGSTNLTHNGNGTAGGQVFEADLGVLLPDTRVDFWVVGNMTRLADASVTVAPLQTILWHHTLPEAKAVSKELDRPTMLLFYSHGSSVSERMDREVFTDNEVITNTSGVVCVRVDAGDNLGLVDDYEVETYPTIIFLDPNGSEVSRRAGTTEAGTLLEELRHLKGEGPGPKDEKVTFIRPFMDELLLIALSFLMFMVILLLVLRSKRWGT